MSRKYINYTIENYQNDTHSLTKHIALQLPNNYKEYDLNFYDILSYLNSCNAYYTYLDSNDIEKLSLQDLNDEFRLGYFYCLYHCNPLIVLDSNKKTTLNNKTAIDNFNYKSSFYLSFIANKNSLSENYLNARKALYNFFQLIKQEQIEELQRNQEELEQALQNLDSKQRESRLKDLQRGQERILREKERQERIFNKNASNKDSKLILESKDKSSVIIFLDSDNSLSNLIHIHNSKIDIFTKDKSTIDIQDIVNNYKDYGITLESLNSANTQIFLYSQLLLGSSEIESNPLYFGEIDSKGVDSRGELDETKPVYYLESNDEFDMEADNTESNNSLSTLNIFLDSSTLTLLNYSLLDSSLNIKLECKSQESKAIKEREQAQREQKEQDCQTRDSQSTAMLFPVLEDNEIKCPHGGVVKLKSNKGKSFKSKNVPMILESDLLNSQIIGCTNNILGVPTPCTLVSIILPSSRALKKYNDDYPIIQDLVNGNVFSDKGFQLCHT